VRVIYCEFFKFSQPYNPRVHQVGPEHVTLLKLSHFARSHPQRGPHPSFFICFYTWHLLLKQNEVLTKF
jgi:hypothetical protein